MSLCLSLSLSLPTHSRTQKPFSENITDRNQTSYTRDPLWRSQDTNLSDTPRLTERSGHGPLVYRDPTAVVTAGGGVSRVVPSFDRERSFGPRVGDEDFPIEVQGRYERMRVLGRGSFGAVTLVKDSRDSKLYAMKTLNVGEKPEERVAAVEEVRLLRKLKHPSLLSLFDTFLSADGRLLCLTTTYCESGDLAKVVKHAAKSKLPLGEKIILGWFAQVGPSTALLPHSRLPVADVVDMLELFFIAQIAARYKADHEYSLDREPS